MVYENELFLVGRILFGGFFAMAGMMHFKNKEMLTQMTTAKGIPFPKLAVMISGIFLILGGLGIVLGFYPQISILLIGLFLIGTIKIHTFWNVEPEQKMTEMMNLLKNMAYIGALLMFLKISTPWAYSLGGLI